jgi:N-acetylglucosaminyldiphosphoundecaprenol N-acetyl-beta-D-mannosaminyltransferase
VSGGEVEAAEIAIPGEGSARGRRVRIGRVWMDALAFPEALRAIEALVASRRGGSVFTPNVDHVVLAEDDAAFRDAYGAASLSLVDGQLLLWASRLLRTPVPEKISGSDLVGPLLELAAARGFSVYLLGGAPGVADEAARIARGMGVRVAGAECPSIRLDDADGEGRAAAERVRAAAPDLVLVALGAPKQERWIHRHLERLRPAVALGVGASLDFLAGRVRRAPRWISRAGLEWAYRLAHEPRRLAHRYLVRDPRFLPILLRTARSPRSTRTR